MAAQQTMREYFDGIRAGEAWATQHHDSPELQRLQLFRAGFGNDHNAYLGRHQLIRRGHCPDLAAALDTPAEQADEARRKMGNSEGGKKAGRGRPAANSEQPAPQVKEKVTSTYSPAPLPQTRDKVAAALGISGPTYAKLKEVAQAAEKDPRRYGDIAEQMDRTGNVSAAHRELRRRQAGKQPAVRRPSPKSSPLEQLRTAWQKATPGDRLEFLRGLDGELIEAWLAERGE